MPDQDFRDYLNRRVSGLKRERQSFDSHWKELAEFVKPRRGRFFVTDRNKGEKKYNSIINSEATKAHRTATAGMLAGTMSPARPWFALETTNPELMEKHEVKEWLWKVEQLLRAIFNESNFYSQASDLISEMLLFGTGCMSHVDDFEDVARFYTHTVGSYYIGQNDRFEVDTLVREFEWTAAQIIARFGLKNVSTRVRTAFDNSNYDLWFPVTHIVEPNDDFRPSKPWAQNKAFRSVYYEPGNSGADRAKYLSQGGFDEFPAHVARWATTGEDVYGTDCPGMVALGDVKQLQTEEKRKAQAIAKMVNPPLTGPASLRNVPITSLPGGLNIYDGGEGRQKLEPLYQVEPRLQELLLDMQAVEQRINTAYFVDLFLAISTMEGVQPRNQLDLMQRNEERLLQLGPVLEHLQGELLEPLMDRTFNQAMRAGILPPAPEALQGRPLRVKHISTLAMAQRAVATQSIDRYALFISSLGEAWPEALKKFNAIGAADEYAKAIGVPPSIVVPDDQVKKQMAEEAALQQAAVAAEAGQQVANVEKTFADANASNAAANERE